MEGEEASRRVWEAREMVKRVVRESEGPIGERRRQLGCLRGQLEDLGASQRVWEASIVFRL